jgi:hypothetical protein
MVLFVLFFLAIFVGDYAYDNPVYHTLMIAQSDHQINAGYAQSLPDGNDRLIDS